MPSDEPPIDYDEIATSYAEHRGVNPVVLDALVIGSGVDSGSKVLEVGSGPGIYIGGLVARTDCTAWAVDPSDMMLDIARSTVPGVHFAWGRGESLKFEDGSLDHVFSVDTIHHIRRREDFFNEAHRVLRPGGLFCTVTDNEETIRQRVPLSSYFPETIEREMGRYPPERDLRREMSWAGFHTIRGEIVEHPYDLVDLAPYRERVFSALHTISQRSLDRGLKRMEMDMELGPIPCVSRYLLLWGTR